MMTPNGEASPPAGESDVFCEGFDRDALVQRCAGNQNLARELSGLFLGNVDQMIQAVERAIDSQDPLAVERAAHGLKGMVANFGATTAVARASEIERLGRSRDIANANRLLVSLTESIATLRTALQRAFDV